MDVARKLMPENLCGEFAAQAETESSAKGALLSPESCRRPVTVKNLIHNSRFDTLFRNPAQAASRRIHTNSNRARQTLPAPTLKGGDSRHDVFIRSLFENQHPNPKMITTNNQKEPSHVYPFFNQKF
jgi:hypothetical protein